MMRKAHTAGELWKEGRDRLLALYKAEEAAVIMDWLFEEFTSLPRARRVVSNDDALASGTSGKIRDALDELALGKPVQYVLGKAWFYGMEFTVDERVLIPRPETEELVRLVLDDQGTGFRGRILDVGTGSGCIAISLAKYLPGATVSALDVESAALDLARKNALKNHAEVDFFQYDLSREDHSEVPAADIIVSNPPYVRESEKAGMHPNVIDHEPHGALFVSDEDPLYYYRQILELASRSLKQGGFVYCEINEAMGRAILALFSGKGNSRVDIIKDMKGKDRFLRFSRRPSSQVL